MLIEAIHSEQYSLLIDTYISDTTDKNNLFKAIETIPAIKKKAEWAIKWIEEGNAIKNIIPKEYLDSLFKLQNEVKTTEFKDALNYLTKERPNLAQRLLAFICVEGIFFSGSFCAIYWLKARGLLPGLATANQFIARDENLHVEFAIELFKTLNLNAQISKEKVEQIVREAVVIEKEFISESLPVSLIGMNCVLMKEYIEYVADRWLVLLGYEKIYNASNPFSFMELISVNDKTNFFESNVSSYQKASVGTKEEQRIFTLEDDF
jgi:ribonucleoside-diphosphate reductase beta chain